LRAEELKPMSSQNPEKAAESIKSAPQLPEDIAAQVRAEYAKFLEKRDAIRKSTGKTRRALLHTLLS
jgi:hypothetical protein